MLLGLSGHGHGNHLLELDGVTLCTPDGKTTLVKDLNLIVGILSFFCPSFHLVYGTFSAR